MHVLILFIIGTLHIALLNIILSFDNISVISVISNNLQSKYIKKAYITGITIAIIFTIFFASMISIIMEIEWLPIQLFCAVFLIKMTWDLLKPEETKGQNDTAYQRVNGNMKLSTAIIKITLASLSLSFDNILAIAGAADGNIKIITCGLLISLPVILFTCRFIMKLIARKKIILYISGAILIHTAFGMIFSYKLITPYIPKIITFIIPLFFSVYIIIYGVHMVNKIPAKVPLVNKFKDNE